jgi:hypothetical protein
LTGSSLKAGKHIRKWLAQVRHSDKRFGDPHEWAERLASSLNTELTAEKALKLGDALEAAREYQLALFELVRKDTGYKIDSHDSDWTDGQQLIYLCDSQMHLVTGDGGISQRIKVSGQRARILPIRQFQP